MGFGQGDNPRVGKEVFHVSQIDSFDLKANGRHQLLHNFASQN